MRFPAASVAVPVSVRSRSIRGIRTTPAAATWSVRRAPFTRSTSVAGSETRSRGGDSDTTWTAGAVASTSSGSSTRAVPRPSTASTETVYVPSAALPRRFMPSHVATCSPAPTDDEKGVATHLPSRRMRTESVAGTVSGTTIETVSPLPSPLGVSAGAESATRPIARVITTGTSTAAVRPPVACAATRTR